jgi:cation transport regulator ChaC
MANDDADAAAPPRPPYTIFGYGSLIFKVTHTLLPSH